MMKTHRAPNAKLAQGTLHIYIKLTCITTQQRHKKSLDKNHIHIPYTYTICLYHMHIPYTYTIYIYHMHIPYAYTIYT
jgi:hypothetical protein